MHLNTDELVDLAEGTRPESSVPHLVSCATCRQQLADARAMMSVAADVQVPEPSPLFWDHFSDRVRQALAAEPAPRRSWIGAMGWPRLLTVASFAMGALVVAVLVSSRGSAPSGPAPDTALTPAIADARPASDLLEPATPPDDPSLTLVAALTADMDWDTAEAAGLAVHGSAEHAVTHLNDEDLRVLRRLLAEELTHSGA